MRLRLRSIAVLAAVGLGAGGCRGADGARRRGDLAPRPSTVAVGEGPSWAHTAARLGRGPTEDTRYVRTAVETVLRTGLRTELPMPAGIDLPVLARDHDRVLVAAIGASMRLAMWVELSALVSWATWHTFGDTTAGAASWTSADGTWSSGVMLYGRIQTDPNAAPLAQGESRSMEVHLDGSIDLRGRLTIGPSDVEFAPALQRRSGDRHPGTIPL